MVHEIGIRTQAPSPRIAGRPRGTAQCSIPAMLPSPELAAPLPLT